MPMDKKGRILVNRSVKNGNTKLMFSTLIRKMFPKGVLTIRKKHF
jgi:hypothetical protein